MKVIRQLRRKPEGAFGRPFGVAVAAADRRSLTAMGQLAGKPGNENHELGGVANMLFMEECSECGAPVTIVGAKPEVIRCPRCAASQGED